MASICFPSPKTANEDGLVFVGGDVTPENILAAYKTGIFLGRSQSNLPMTWFSLTQEVSYFVKSLNINKTLQKFLKKNSYLYP